MEDELISQLIDFLEEQKIVFISFEPEIIDFRKQYQGTVSLHGKETIEFLLPKITTSFVGILTSSLFTDKIILSWDIKRFFSYLYFNLPKHYKIDINSKIIDIKYTESFFDINENCPKSLTEAQKRIKKCSIHQSIHIPLAIEVIPRIETYGFLDKELKKQCYSSYEIEGQTNGRLGCRKEFADAVTVHQLNRTRYIPNLDHVFVQFDYKAMEVYILQYLSQDERLAKIISSGKDIYKTIALLTEVSGRSFVKETFLPIVYGMQPNALAERQEISISEAKKYIDKLYSYFQTAFSWIESQSEKLKTNLIVEDYFGRPRNHKEKPWAVRNAVIQGPAATVCLEKLIDLHKNVSGLFANIHDAYFLEIHKNDLDEVVKKSISILESESKLCPKLKLKIDVNFGVDLNDLKSYKLNQ